MIVSADSVWIAGCGRGGKTTRLVEKLRLLLASWQRQSQLTAVLALAAIGDNRIDLADRMVQVTEGRYPVDAKTQLQFSQRSCLEVYGSVWHDCLPVLAIRYPQQAKWIYTLCDDYGCQHLLQSVVSGSPLAYRCDYRL